MRKVGRGEKTARERGNKRDRRGECEQREEEKSEGSVESPEVRTRLKEIR